MTLKIVTTPEEFISFTTPSVQRYFSSFLQSDRTARHPHAHCMAAYLGNLLASPPQQIVDEVEKRIPAAERAISSFAISGIPAVMRTTSATLPWRVAFFRRGVEKGWPHTHGTVICFPEPAGGSFGEARRLVELLVHERLHILQRLHPRAAREFIKERYGSSVVPRIARVAMPRPERERIYANPDVDEYEYDYSGDRHPYESMAYDVASAAVSYSFSS